MQQEDTNRLSKKHLNAAQATIQEDDENACCGADKPRKGINSDQAKITGVEGDHQDEHEGHSHDGSGEADGWRSHWALLTALAILLIMQ